MRKIYTTICVLALSISSIAQVGFETIKNHSDHLASFSDAVLPISNVINSNNSSISSATNIIWESDFSSPSDWTLDNTGSFTSEGWNIDANMDSWYLPAFASTSGGNFAELGNGDPNIAGWPIQVEYTMTTANPINIYDSIGSGSAMLSFEEFGARFNDLQAIQVSIDGVTFTTIGDNLSYPVTSQSAGSNPYPNPSLREINLAPYLGSNPTTVWIRFSWTTNYPTLATDPNVWITYGWCIDNVKIAESPANRVVMQDEVIGGFWIDYANYSGAGLNDIYGLDYSITPLSQLANHPYAIEAVFRNEGTESQSVNLTYDVTGTATYNGSSNVSVLNTGDSILLGASFSPSATGQYTIDIWGIADSLGAGVTTTMTNVETRNIEVTNYIYGKDLGNASGSYLIGGPSDQNHLTTRYEMYANEQLYSLRVYITDASNIGAEIKAIIYEADSTGNSGVSFYDESDNYTIVAQDLGSWVDIPFVNPIALLNGYAYECGIVGFQHPTDSSYVGVSGPSMYNGEHSVWDEYGLSTQSAGTPTWYYTTSCPMVRMNFDPSSGTAQSFDCVGVSCVDPGTGMGTYFSLAACEQACIPSGLEESESNISIYPNPSNGDFVIELDGAGKYDVTVYNVLGQTVFSTFTNAMITRIDLSSFDKGIYTVELRDENTIYTDKVIVE